MTCGEFLRNLFWRIDGRVHRAEKRSFGVLEGRGKLRESKTTGGAGATGATDDHEVNIAPRLLLLASERAVDESNRDADPEWL